MEDALTHIELITTECSPAMSAPEIAAFGVAIIIPDDVPSSILMEVLVLKISKPEEFLPVSGAVMRPSDDGQGTYREMQMGPNTIKENIYADHSTNEVTFVNTEKPEEIMNCITTNSAGVRSLEFYRRDSNTKERLEWSVPKHIALNGIQACIDRATRILESQSK